MSRTRCLAVLVFAMTLVSARADASTYVVDQAGNGDFTTITAAMAAHNAGFKRDTIYVHAGAYAETLVLSDGLGGSLLMCTAGPESTSVLGASFGYAWTVTGLTVLGPQLTNLRGDWNGCRFQGGVYAYGQAWGTPRFSDCDFYGPTRLQDYTGGMSALRFHHAPLTLYVNGPGAFWLTNASFEGLPGDTLVWLDGSEYMGFTNCTFAGGAYGVYAARPRAESYMKCRFSDLGVAFEGHNMFAQYADPANLIVDSCHFERCGRAIDASFNGGGGGNSHVDFWLRYSTITGCTGDAVTVRNSVVGLLDARVTDDRFEHGGGTALVGSFGQLALRNCAFFDNEGAGAAITFTDTSQVSTIQQNTFAFNLGDGLSLAATAALSVPRQTSVAANIVAQNGGAGIRYASPYTGGLSYNDSWQNYGAEYVGVTPNATNVSLDPKFCDLVNGDLTLSAGSPFAPGSAFGRAGAYGVGCDTELLDAPPIADAASLAARPNPARGVVTFALPGHASSGALEVLDVQGRRVWRAPIDAGAMSVQWRGEREGGARAGAGIYWVRVQRGATTTQTKRFIWLE